MLNAAQANTIFLAPKRLDWRMLEVVVTFFILDVHFNLFLNCNIGALVLHSISKSPLTSIFLTVIIFCEI